VWGSFADAEDDSVANVGGERPRINLTSRGNQPHMSPAVGECSLGARCVDRKHSSQQSKEREYSPATIHRRPQQTRQQLAGGVAWWADGGRIRAPRSVWPH